MVTQEEVRDKLIKRVEREKQTYIANRLQVPNSLISAFKTGKKNLWEKTLIEMNDYLENHYIS